MHLNRDLNTPMLLDVNYNRRSHSQVKLIIDLRMFYEDIDEAFDRKSARVHRLTELPDVEMGIYSWHVKNIHFIACTL